CSHRSTTAASPSPRSASLPSARRSRWPPSRPAGGSCSRPHPGAARSRGSPPSSVARASPSASGTRWPRSASRRTTSDGPVVSLTRRRMNDGSPHELSAAYALDALDGPELEAYETHLAGRERCRQDVASFRATASALAYDVDLPPPPETLEHRILVAARAERPNVGPLRQRLALPAVALSAVAAVAAIAIGIWAVHLSSSLDRQKQ